MNTPALKLGPGPYAKEHCVSEDLKSVHWWARAMRWIADKVLNGGL